MGMIHCPGIALLSGPGVIFGIIYLMVAVFLFSKGYYFEEQTQGKGPGEPVQDEL